MTTTCRACGHTVSNDAKTCPKCGQPKPSQRNWGCVIAIIIIVIALASMS